MLNNFKDKTNSRLRHYGRVGFFMGVCLLTPLVYGQDPSSLPNTPVEKNDTELPSKTAAQLLKAAIPEADRGIGPHEPVYFLWASNWRGAGDYGIKFQFSLKYRVLNPETPATPKWWERFYLGYTQTSLWDLQADSRPFKDSAYRPEVFWDQPQFSGFPKIKALAGLRAGFGHESNGRDGAESRSIDLAYIRPTFTLPVNDHGYILSFSPKIYTYLDRSDNPDIADYRGHSDLVFKLEEGDSWEVTTTLHKGNKDHYGSMQLDVSYPFRGFLHNLNGYLHLQYFNGYGETILDYNVKQPSRVGLGIIVVR